MKIKVNKISMRPDIDWTKGRPAVCDGDVAFMEMKMTLKSVALVWNGSEWMAFAPRLNRMGEGIMWDAGGSFAKEIAEHLLEAYQRMGGEMPPSKQKKASKPRRIYVPVEQLDMGAPSIFRITSVSGLRWKRSPIAVAWNALRKFGSAKSPRLRTMKLSTASTVFSALMPCPKRWRGPAYEPSYSGRQGYSAPGVGSGAQSAGSAQGYDERGEG